MSGFSANDSSHLKKTNPKITELNELWCTEVHCTEILPFCGELVDKISAALHRQQSVVEGMHADKDPDIVFRSTLYLMDIERIRFALNRYLRTRLKKIESQLDYVVSTPDVVDMLSERERGFAFELHGLNGRYMTETVVERLSAQQAVEGADDMLRHSYPQQQEFVFCRAKQTISGIDVGSNKIVDVVEGEVQLLPYTSVRNHVFRREVHLI